MGQKNPTASLEPDLEAYRFDERDWEGYEEVYETFEWEVPDEFNVASFICDRWAEATADRVAMFAVDTDGDDTVYTYERLQNLANRLANYLATRGIERGDRVAVSGAQTVECLAAHIAAWKLGAVSVPLSLLFGPDGLEYRLDDSGATAFVVHDASLPALREVETDCEALETVLAVGDLPAEGDEVPFRDALDGQPAAFETVTTDAQEPAIIMYTSGTTGTPKGVVHAHRSLLGVLPLHLTSLRNMDRRADDVLYTPGEWSWIGPLYGFVLAGLYYGTAILGDADPQFDPARTLELVEQYDVVSIAAPTTAYRAMMQVPDASERFDLSSLRIVFEGGESLGQTVVDWWRERVEDVAIHEGYGQTESGICVGDCEALGVAHRPGKMGKSLPGYEVAVFDPETDESVADDEIGELAVRFDGNPGCFLEYWHEPEKTARKVRDGWLRTEDVGSITADGYASFHSRTDDVIISAGYRIGPAEIEESLAGHEAVADAGVIGVPHDQRGEIPKAFVVLADDHDPSADLTEALRTHVKDRLAKYEYPRELAFVDALPKTTTGKVRRHDLREREESIEEP